jgi:Flp pilus assembly protein protease CpaA
MAEASPLYTWIDILCAAAALAAVMAAAVIDHKTLRIPNGLTFPFIFLGLAFMVFRCISGFSLPTAVITCIVAYLFVYVLWRGRMWGGGDAKLVLALFLLMSPAFHPLAFMAAFSLCLAITLFLEHSILRAFAVDKTPRPMGPALFLAYIISAFTAGLVP